MEKYERRTSTTIIECKNSVVKKLLLHLLDIYTLLISPYVPTECRYYPTCSCYMKDAIEKKGILKGALLGAKRILKCNPFFPGGYDPVK